MLKQWLQTWRKQIIYAHERQGIPVNSITLPEKLDTELEVFPEVRRCTLTGQEIADYEEYITDRVGRHYKVEALKGNIR